MDGDLLEVTLDEVQQLWQLLQTDAEFLIAFEKGEKEDEEEREGQAKRERGGEREAKQVQCASLHRQACTGVGVRSVFFCKIPNW